MPATNTATRYGSVTKSFHWLTALLILTVIPLGIIANGLPYETSEELARKAWLFSLHKTVGVTIFFVALARIGWAITQPKPAPIHAGRPVEHFLAEMVHWLLYGSLVLVPLSGWIHHASTEGFAPIWWPFGQDLFFVPKNPELAEFTAGLHIVLERVLAVSLVLHIAGAIKHALIDKDETLSRMLPGSTQAGIKENPRSRTPLIGAVVVWLAALGIGSAVGAFSHDGPAVQQVALEEVSSDWQVQDGAISITVTQFGSEVTGSFADWTSEITFEDGQGPGQRGSVRTVVAIPSLSLGTVTDQAMGPDFFNTAEHPTAVFEADLFAEQDEVYLARGTLTIKGQSVPLDLPFSLDIQDATAQMSAQITLNRLDFGVGASMADESSLAFAVVVDITLTAQRSTDQ